MAAIIKANTIAIAAIMQIAPIIWFAFRGVFPCIGQYRIRPTNGIKIVAPKNTYHVVCLKGIFYGIGLLIVVLCMNEKFAALGYFAFLNISRNT